MEDQTQQNQQTVETPSENQTSEAQASEQTPAVSVETSTPTEEIPTVPCDCKCIHQLGYVEVELADGTKQQMTVQQAQDELTKFENIKQALEGGAQHATE